MVISGFAGGLAGGAVVSIVIRAVDQFSGTMNRANVSINKLEKSTKALRLAGLAAAVGIGASVKQFIEFESAFTGVRKTVELTEAGFEDLENRFKQLSTEIPITFVELSKIGELAGQLGVSGVDNLEKFTRTIADISRTTNLTAEVAATDFARIANIMQEPIENIDRMGSAVVELGNNLATTESEIVTFATRIAGTAKVVGLNTADIFAIGAAFSSVGVQAERGGTAVVKVLQTMSDSIVESGDQLELFARTAGLTTIEFSDLFEKDAAGAFELFIKGLGEQGKEGSQILKELELGDTRLIQSFLALAGAGNLLSDALSLANTEFEVNTALTEEAGKRYETLESKMAILKNQVKLLGNEFGEQLAPILSETIIPILGNLLDAFREAGDDTKKLFTELGTLLTVSAGLSFIWKTAARRLLIFGAIAIITENIFERLGFTWADLVNSIIRGLSNLIFATANIITAGIEFIINDVIGQINLIIKAANALASIFGGPQLSLIGNVSFGRANLIEAFPKGASLPVPFQNQDLVPLGQGQPEQVINFNIEIANITGLDPEDISRALSDELTNKGVPI